MGSQSRSLLAQAQDVRILAFFIRGLDDQSISAHGDMVREAIELASTLWPIALAAVLGALVHTVALFRAEQGTELGVSGSRTLATHIDYSTDVVQPRHSQFY
ncbi:unnamed protein product [Fusarium venenatum]|uniref:Uncharacterized protein n=1 Tax=Fusarium venenatum TaxID=56646 RepID=A0A2L2TCZ9_9HYPO|nr:uncharacterized protein FVRRES_02415 [Fusarium venenatum]CEI65903.1 unnamed protein product [Fusarium venenatum]